METKARTRTKTKERKPTRYLLARRKHYARLVREYVDYGLSEDEACEFVASDKQCRIDRVRNDYFWVKERGLEL